MVDWNRHNEKNKYVKVSKMKLLAWMETCGVVGFALGLLAARSIWGFWHVVVG